VSDEEAIALWKKKVFDRAEEIDPDSNDEWRSMALGFLLALDFEPDRAEKVIQRLVELWII
jgi:hypothetical protein